MPIQVESHNRSFNLWLFQHISKNSPHRLNKASVSAILVVIYSYKVPVAENILVKTPEHHFDEPFNSSWHLERWKIHSLRFKSLTIQILFVATQRRRHPSQYPERVECYMERASPNLANPQTVSTYSIHHSKLAIQTVLLRKHPRFQKPGVDP